MRPGPGPPTTAGPRSTAASSHAKTAGFLYQAVLRDQLTRRLGLEWEPVHNGAADVQGIDRSLIEHFSERRHEILDAMAARGALGPGGADRHARHAPRQAAEAPKSL